MDYLNNLEKSFEEICNECHTRGEGKCSSRACNVGFAKYTVKSIKNSEMYSIADGENLIPKDDFKYYDERVIGKGIANICRLCRDCNEYHSEDCIIALTRRTLEYTQLKDRITYPGNVLLYLMNLAKQRPELAELVREEYEKIG